MYFDPEGSPITIDLWAEWMNSPKRPSRVSKVDGRQLKTTYLGFVDPAIPGTRLYGSAVFSGEHDVVEVDLYDSRDDAYDGHTRHRAAMVRGFHCHRCELGQEHP